MTSEKDVRFTNKKVDESWKEQAERERSVVTGSSPVREEVKQKQSPAPPKPSPQKAEPKSSQEFLRFLNTLAYQVLMHLGEVPYPGTEQIEQNPDQAKELIDILVALKEKVHGNTGPEEDVFFNSVLSELQMKYVNLK